MALAEQLSIDRLRTGAANVAQRGKAFTQGRAVRVLGARARGRRTGSIAPAASIGFAAIAVPWLVVVLARWSDPTLGRGRIVADPWSLLAPGWGAWSLVGLLIVAVAALVSWARLRLAAPDVSRTFAVAIASLLAFALWCGASVFLWSSSPSGAWRWTVVAIGVVVASVLGLFAGAQQEGRRGIVLGVLATGTLTATIGLIDLLAFSGGARRVVSPLDPTANAVVIGIGVLVAIALDQGEHPQRRRLLRAAATLGIAALLLTASRSGIAVTVFGMFVLAFRGVPIGWPLMQATGGALPGAVTAMLAVGVARDGTTDDTGRLLVGGLIVGGAALVAWSAARDLGAPPALRRLGQSKAVLPGLMVLIVVAVV
ncbi:MAG: hypothetical protein Q7T55_01760, partial [Solirubrobacteraceae bacterium]|nr:hypothetical protein [Solirubrobacteraceae bacterium]